MRPKVHSVSDACFTSTDLQVFYVASASWAPDSWADAAHALNSAIIKRLASHHEGLLWPALTTPEPAVSTSLQDTRGKSSWITVSNEEGARQGVGELSNL